MAHVWMPFRNVAAGASSRLACRSGGRKRVVHFGSLPVRGLGRLGVFCGIEVARETHHVVALDAGGRRLVDRPLPNAEPELVQLFAELEAHGPVLVVVDQLASIGALAVAVARPRGVTVGYLPGLSMRRIADLYPGQATTDARDAHIIADAGRTLPHTLRRVGAEEHTTVQLAVLAGYDAHLATEATRLPNRLHDALLHVHPALERLLGRQFRSPGRAAVAGRDRQRSQHWGQHGSRRPSPRAHRGSRPGSPGRSSLPSPSRRS
jgi:hypothetical protein